MNAKQFYSVVRSNKNRNYVLMSIGNVVVRLTERVEAFVKDVRQNKQSLRLAWKLHKGRKAVKNKVHNLAEFCFSANRIDATIFWDFQIVLFIDIFQIVLLWMQYTTTVAYWVELQYLWKKYRFLTKNVSPPYTWKLPTLCVTFNSRQTQMHWIG